MQNIDHKNGKVIHVLIGQVILTHEPNILQSILGSCIGLVFYDSKALLAGMAHIFLPSSTGRKESGLSGKYADGAVESLYQAMISRGATQKNIRAKMSGGAHMLKGFRKNENKDIGSLNAIAVQSLLKEMRIPLVAQDIGGTKGRLINFYISTLQLTVEDFCHNMRII